MSKIFMTKKKIFTAIVAGVLAVVIMLGGTFAWQSINQEALNEVSAVRNPGGRLHDDFNDITVETNAKTMTYDKNVYVENFTTLAENGVQIFARVRLDEYMEFGKDAGVEGNTTAKSLVYGAELDNKTTWTTHIPGNTEDPFHTYWNWDTTGDNDGKVTYMPTFNKNRDSLEADINGTFDADFTDYTDYTLTANQSVEDTAVYDDDDNTEDEIVNNNYTVDYAEQCGYVTTKTETHTATESLSSYVMTMDTWLTLPADQQVGNFWVWDNDGWAYWANPINPETATGLLLDGISRTETIINEDWYYAINVVAQFITKDDMGKENNTGFYDSDAGVAPSSNALILLNAIGVDVNTTVTDADGLQTALNLGGNITINGDVAVTENSTDAYGEEYPMGFVWTTGGSLTGGTLTNNIEGTYTALFISAEKDYPEGSGATAAVMSDVEVTAYAGQAIYAQAVDANITLNEVTAMNTYGIGVFAEYGDERVTLNGCIVTSDSATSSAPEYNKTAVAVANGAEMVINGGTYTGTYAAYVYSTGGSITILDGTFNGELKADAGEIVIKGGSFSVNPSDYLAEGYTATLENGMYIVK